MQNLNNILAKDVVGSFQGKVLSTKNGEIYFPSEEHKTKGVIFLVNDLNDPFSRYDICIGGSDSFGEYRMELVFGESPFSVTGFKEYLEGENGGKFGEIRLEGGVIYDDFERTGLKISGEYLVREGVLDKYNEDTAIKGVWSLETVRK